MKKLIAALSIFIIFILFHCPIFSQNLVKDSGFEDGKTTVKLEKLGKPKSVMPYHQWVLMMHEIKEWKLKYGTYKDSVAQFNIGVFDKNKNGVYTDKYEDILFVGAKNDSSFQYTSSISSRACLLKKTIFLNYNNTALYKIITLNQDELVIEKVKKGSYSPDLIFYDRLPDIELKFLNEDKSINLTSLANGKPTKFIFFVTWCPPCWKEMEEIYRKKLYESYNIVSIFSGGAIEESLAIIEEKKYPWLFLKSNEKINKIFSQNGFPYIVSFDKNGIFSRFF